MKKSSKREFEALTEEQLTALREFAAAHGRSWKSELNIRWMRASAGHVLHRIRNTHGPEWLASFELPLTGIQAMRAAWSR